MTWRWRLGEFFGIVVYVHATFLLLIGWVAFASLQRGGGLLDILTSILLILALFTCVVMHEYGHALTARHYGIRTQDITLLPIGGIARLERMPRDPVQELWVALAGPAVNLVIAAVLYLLVALFEGVSTLANVQFIGAPVLNQLLYWNLAMAIFNMLPAFPMDGGRVLRALLARRMEYARATRAAANVGQAMAFLFALGGLFGGMPFLLFIAIFVYLGAEAEAQMVQTQSTFRGLPVHHAMITRFATLDARETLADAVRALLSGTQQDFPVMEEGQVVGLLTRRDLLAALSENGPRTPVGEAMHAGLSPVESYASLEESYQRMQTEDLPALPVTDAGRLVGLLTMENIIEFVMIRTATGKFAETFRPARQSQ